MHPLKYFDNRDYDLIFGWISKKKVGLINPKKYSILINVHLLLVETFVHEQTHDEHPDIEDEAVIEAKTRRKIKKMTVNEIEELGEKLLSILLLSKKHK